jgi:hypothetical protein
MRVVNFTPEHLKALELQPAQQWMREIVSEPGYAENLLQGRALTVLEGDTPLAVFSLFTIWPGRAYLCALISASAGSSFIRFHRVALGLLQTCGVRRVEATVDGDFQAGHRWLRLLGFTLETPGGMAGYRPDGGTNYLYARVA